MSRPGSQIYQTSLSTSRIVTNPWIILLVLAMGFFMILLDTTIVNVAIPSIIDGLHASLDQILWVLNAYLLVYAVLLITSGRLGDMFGPKKMFLSGLVVFLLSSAACGLAQSPEELIFFRVLQGVGGAILTPQTLSIITSIFPPEKRGAAFGLWAAVAGVAAATGPTLGGFPHHGLFLAGYLLRQRANRDHHGDCGLPVDA
jgi:MFS family permease